MRVFVAGATGVAGRRAARDLVAAGHDVSGVARSPSKAALLQSLGATPVEVDLFDANEVQRAVRGHDAVVNLATSIPTSAARMAMRSAWGENDRIRRQVSRNLVEAAIATRVECLIQESIAFMYEDRKDDWIDEDVPIESAPHADSALEAEGQARRFTESGGRGIVLRFGQFYAADAPHTVTMVKVARRGISPFVGPPRAYLPLLHADDIATAVVAALQAPSGIYNVSDDEPLRRHELARVLAGALGKRKLRNLPYVGMKLSGITKMYLRSQRASNRRFKEVTGWTPLQPTPKVGLPVVVRAIQGAGEA
nr:NAD(P)-dependent oxidoreductase [Actinomycetota bacterium]